MEQENNLLAESLSERNIFYAALFLSGKPVELSRLSKILTPFNLENRLLEYAETFNMLSLGMRIRNVSGGFQMVSDAMLSKSLENFFGEKAESLSKSALETAAIIAYRQPVTKAEVEKIRGVDCSGSMRTLVDRNFITVTGRRSVPGRPLLYGTTKFFMEYFGLNDITELPTLREWQELRNG